MPIYDGFISYSHVNDKTIASALQSAIQKLGKPWYQRRGLRVFRDDTSLSATPQLWPSIESALTRSRYFILLASPEAAMSPWVAKELLFWLEHNSIETLLIGITDGTLSWDENAGDFDWSATTCLPAPLVGQFPSEPRWVDLRSYRRGTNPRDNKLIDAAADFAATCHGVPKEDLLSQEVRQQRRALTLAWSTAALLTLLIMFAGWQWNAALKAERVAVEQEKTALQQRDKALLTQSRFLTDLADQRVNGNNNSAAILLALTALPDHRSGIERPYIPAAERALFDASQQLTEVMVLPDTTGVGLSAHFSPDGRRIVTASADNTGRLWNAENVEARLFL